MYLSAKLSTQNIRSKHGYISQIIFVCLAGGLGSITSTAKVFFSQARCGIFTALNVKDLSSSWAHSFFFKFVVHLSHIRTIQIKFIELSHI